MLRRVLAPLFDSYPASFDVPGSPEEGRRLLMNALGSMWFPSTRRTPLLGAVMFGRVTVVRNHPWGSLWATDSFIPAFRGKLESNGGRTLLVGQFGMRRSIQVFVVLWFGSFPFLAASLLRALPSSPDMVFVKALVLVFLLAIAGVILYTIHATWRAHRGDIEFITHEIQRALRQHGT
jgi:hypothetical protein